MKRVIGVLCLLVLFFVAAARGPAAVQVVAAAGDPHAYFNGLVARADHWKSYSLRDSKQLDYPKNGGYAECNSCPLYVTYDPAHDPDPRRQDAAKIRIPDFIPSAQLAQPVAPGDTTIVLAWTPALTFGRAIKVDGEVMMYVGQSAIVNNIVPVARAQHGTTATSHAAGARIHLSTNSLPNQVRVPMGTRAGHTYLVTWDAWWGAEFSFDRTNVPTHKTFQFASRGIWWEMQTRYALGRGGAGIGEVSTRTYSGVRGPEVTSADPMPQVGTFMIQPERWTRYWALIDQTASDYDRVSLWVADEQVDPVKIIDRMPLKAVNGIIDEFFLEYNTSTPNLKAGRGPLTAYVRNIVMLQDVGNATSLMVRPLAGTALPAPTPGTAPRAPTNLRILVQ